MTLKEKLDNIEKTSTVKKLNEYPNLETAKDLDELWVKVISDSLPDKDVVVQWHKLLMKYIKQDNAVFTLRKYGSGNEPRRGFLNKVFICGEESFGTFYTDNSVPFYFYSMAKDGFVPDLAEFNDAMINNHTFPYGYFPSSTGKNYVAYPLGKNHGINAKGYKLAHIFSTGENYSANANYLTIDEFCEAEFPQGNMLEWGHHTLSNGKHYRPIYIDDEIKAKTVRAFAVAHFLRSVHPINYFLSPLTTGRRDKASNIKKTNIYWYDHVKNEYGKDIGEYPPLIEYVAAQINDIYKDVVGDSGKTIWQEFLDLIYPTGNCVNPTGVNMDIDAEYAIDIWKKQIGSTPTHITASCKGTTATKATSKSRTYNKYPKIAKEFLPNDLNSFENELLNKKKAKITLIYADGHTLVKYWDARKYKSNLEASVYCQLRKVPDRDDIVKAIFEV